MMELLTTPFLTSARISTIVSFLLWIKEKNSIFICLISKQSNTRAIAFEIADILMKVESHISGVFDLFLPLKNSGKARLSIAWMLQKDDSKVEKCRKMCGKYAGTWRC